MLIRLLVGCTPVIAVLVAAAFVIPAGTDFLLRQFVLCAIGVAGIVVAERLLFARPWRQMPAALGFVVPRPRTALLALVVSLPMWLSLPLYGSLAGTPFGWRGDALQIVLGVILLNGIAEEVIHRAFVFGRLRATRGFRPAATLSALVFAGQHFYLLFTTGAMAGTAAVVLALAVAFPLAFVYERGGHSLAAPAILHTGSNAPMMLFAPPQPAAGVLLMHMAVVLGSMYLCLAVSRFESGRAQRRPTVGPTQVS